MHLPFKIVDFQLISGVVGRISAAPGWCHGDCEWHGTGETEDCGQCVLSEKAKKKPSMELNPNPWQRKDLKEAEQHQCQQVGAHDGTAIHRCYSYMVCISFMSYVHIYCIHDYIYICISIYLDFSSRSGCVV